VLKKRFAVLEQLREGRQVRHVFRREFRRDLRLQVALPLVLLIAGGTGSQTEAR